ncbi:MAG: GntR family transcriptional regulator [Propioniciclava sp.]
MDEGVRPDPGSTAPGTRASSLLKNRAYETLLQRIVRGELVPGQRLSERSLSAELRMSKTPVKAALERLEEQGFITLSPQRRAVVRGMSDKDIADHYELRGAIEQLVVTKLAGGLSAANADTITETLDRQRAIIADAPPLVGWAEADYDFHLALAHAAGNQEVLKIMYLQRDRLSWLVEAIVRKDPTAPLVTCQEHEDIFQFIQEGRAAEAAAAVDLHLRNGLSFMLDGAATYAAAAEDVRNG